jgi:hypothetical protein
MNFRSFTMKKKNFIISLIIMIFVVSAQAQTFKAGVALRIITPDPLLPVSGGVGIPSPVTQKKGDLFVRVMVLEKENTRVAIVGMDNLGWPAVLGDRVRKLVKGIPPENILIGVTHTHSAPDAYGFTDQSGNTGFDLKHIDWCVQQMADAINEAVTKLEPVVLKIAMGDAKGNIAWNAYAADLYDPRCGIIQAIASTGKRKDKPLVTLVNYAVHPEVIGSDRGILTPDLCGPLYDRIEAKVGGMAIFMNGAIGGMVTADNRREGGREVATWEECIRIGELLADEALRIIEEAEVQENPDLYCTFKDIQFPIDSKMMRFILKSSPLKYNIGEDFKITTRLNLVNIGTAQILTIPGEALPNIGYYLKRNMKTKQPFLFGLTNDAFGYIITKVDYNSFERYNYITRTCLGEKTGEIYIEACLELIKINPGAEKF